jgi:hypothetical protein
MSHLAASIDRLPSARTRPNDTFLRRVLLADAVASAGSGLLMLAGASLLEGLLGLPAPLLMYAGLGLLPFAAFVAYAATRERLSRVAVWVVIVLNAIWVAHSLLLLVSDWVAPSAFGYAFVTAQAAAVAILAELEYLGLRRMSSSEA